MQLWIFIRPQKDSLEDEAQPLFSSRGKINTALSCADLVLFLRRAGWIKRRGEIIIGYYFISKHRGPLRWMPAFLYILCLSFVHGYVRPQLVRRESGPRPPFPSARVCVCVPGELMRRDCHSFSVFPNPICSNKRLKGRESGDPAGQEGKDNNTYPWATFQHMQPLSRWVMAFIWPTERTVSIEGISEK